MTTKPVEEQKYTLVDLLAMPDDGKRYELIEGEIVATGTSNRKHSTLGVWLVFKLMTHVMTARLGGRVGGADTMYILDAANVKAPDVSYLTPARDATVPPGTVFCPFGPNFAIEIKSPSDSGRYMRWLAALYIRTGTTLVWVIDPVDEIVSVYRAGQIALELSEGILDASDVIAGFTIDMAEMFAQIARL